MKERKCNQNMRNHFPSILVFTSVTADAMRTSLNPYGIEKMICFPSEDAIITNYGTKWRCSCFKPGDTYSSNPSRRRNRVEAEMTSFLKQAKDGSAFTQCEGCNKDVPVVLIDMHSYTLDCKIRMKLEV